MKRFLLIFIFLFVFGCTNDDDATRILSQNGYTNIQMTGYNFFACSKDDTFHSGFRALSPDGKHTVVGTVCSGLIFKNSTIRFN